MAFLELGLQVINPEIVSGSHEESKWAFPAKEEKGPTGGS
jgi:hypothetical protein